MARPGIEPAGMRPRLRAGRFFPVPQLPASQPTMARQWRARGIEPRPEGRALPSSPEPGTTLRAVKGLRRWEVRRNPR